MHGSCCLKPKACTSGSEGVCNPVHAACSGWSRCTCGLMGWCTCAAGPGPCMLGRRCTMQGVGNTQCRLLPLLGLPHGTSSNPWGCSTCSPQRCWPAACRVAAAVAVAGASPVMQRQQDRPCPHHCDGCLRRLSLPAISLQSLLQQYTDAAHSCQPADTNWDWHFICHHPLAPAAAALALALRGTAKTQGTRKYTESQQEPCLHPRNHKVHCRQHLACLRRYSLHQQADTECCRLQAHCTSALPGGLRRHIVHTPCRTPCAPLLDPHTGNGSNSPAAAIPAPRTWLMLAAYL
jgi:hypothetical protein